MPPKLSDRMGIVEERLSAVENSIRQELRDFREMMMQEFRDTMMSEFTKLWERRQSVERPTFLEEFVIEYKMAVKKVELPSFDGDDLMGWVTRAETYFEVQGTSEEVKIRLAKLSMEGATIHWFNLLRETDDDLTWLKLKQDLIERYGGRQSDNPFEEMKDLQQTGTVDEYITTFEYVSSQVGRLPEEQYLGYFMGGLKTDIRLRVRTINPRSRVQKMKIARDVETEMRGSLLPRVSAGGPRNWKGSGSGGYGLSWKTGYGSQHNPGSTRVGNGSTNYSAGSVQSKTGSSPSNPNGNTNANTSTTISIGDEGRRYEGERNCGLKHLPYSELMERKAQGLCFRCGEKYHTLHQCAEKQLRLVILGDDETINEEGEVIAIEVKEDEEEVLDCNSMGLFGIIETNIKSNNTPPTTLRLQGSLKGVSIMILIDNGASHNFVSPHVASALGLNVEQGRSMGVKLGDGHRVSTRGRCRKLEVCLNDFTTSVDAYVLELGDLDMILGVAWLQRLRKVTFDWEMMTISFLWEGKMMELHGQFFTTKEVSTNNISHAPMDFLHSLLEEEVVPANEVQELTEVQKQELNELLRKFKGVFEENTGLPPKREINHAIELQKDDGPVSVRPYRYPHHHKEEIEKQVQSMLSQGIIRNSSSAFSSPIILVKKR